ncbi:MAG TPA: aminoglycoside phosphotransferase family protein [Streptosporangiaceae bacterium]
MTKLLAPIEGFASDAVGRLQAVADRSWPRDSSNVWEIVNDDGDHFYLKQHSTARFHEREVTAYRNWTAGLGLGRAAVLLAADAKLRSVVITALPGQPARDLHVPQDTEIEIHRQAGMLLRRLHDAAPACSSSLSADRAVARVEEHLKRASGLLEPAQVRLIRYHAAQLEQFAPLLPAVPTHGDAQARNFLWNTPNQQLALIDFERAEVAPAVRDLVRLEYGPWDDRPDLRVSFLGGYGRILTNQEETALRGFAATDALSGLQWGTANNDNEVTARAHRTLERLSAEDRP